MIWFSLLLASWVLLTLAICSCLCSYYTGKLAHQTSLAEIHASAPVPKSEQPPLSFFGRICGGDEKWSCATEILNNLALIFLIAAIILTVAFAAVNVNNLNSAYSERCRSAFRTDADRDSNLMPITIPK
jgi:hypothetical protein